MKISDDGLALIKEFEGLRLQAYQDSVGVWTIGYGHTGKDVLEGQRISEERAGELLLKDVEGCERCVNGLVNIPMTQGQFDALCSFVFNLGCGRLRNSTLLQCLNDGNDVEAADQFLRWNKAGGYVLPGLTRRREAERKLFMGG